MVVPTPRHVEQAWNASETEAAGAGIYQSDFDLDPLLRYLRRHQPPTDQYREWVREGGEQMIELIEHAARGDGRGHRLFQDGFQCLEESGPLGTVDHLVQAMSLTRFRCLAGAPP